MWRAGNGQTLFKLFKYLGIMEKLKLQKMDEDMVDGIMFKGDPKVTVMRKAMTGLSTTWLPIFRKKRKRSGGIVRKLRIVCAKFPPYNLRLGEGVEKNEVLGIDTQLFLESITDNKKLQSVLAGTNVLYAGEAYKTPLYVHALVTNSYIESSYRFINGGSQIAILLTKEIFRVGAKSRNTNMW